MPLIEYNDTISLMKAMERVKPPARFLLDTFFPKIDPIVPSSKIMLEYREGRRKLAPFIVKGSKGVNIKRDTSHMEIYAPPMVGPRRVINPEDIEQRSFGETIYSTMTPAQRAAQLQAHDLIDLQDEIINRKNKMAADILTTGKCEIKGFADDGKTELIDVIEFNRWNQKIIPTTKWDQAGATIYSDIKNASEMIQEKTGMIPTLMVCGKNIEQYLINNTEISKWLMIPNRDNLAMMTIAPRYESPAIRRIGLLTSLNLEMYAYNEVYEDDDGQIKSFIGADDVIIGIGGTGRQIHGAVTLLNDAGNSYNTFLGEYVPYYHGDKTNQTISLTMYSRFLLCPTWSDEWATIKAKGE
ncbi:MAG: major capsid protein [Selenomonadaceae bacterium]|nr:major capsid protein [Selenomonadaceae bacterium]